MDENFIDEYISIGIDSFEDAEAIFRLSSKYFLEIKEEGYKSEKSELVEGLLNKMVSIGEYFELDEALLEEITSVSINFASVFGNPNQNVSAKLPHFNKAFSVSMKFYNAMGKEKPKKNIDLGPFRPSNCDKPGIVAKIMEAVEMIDKTTIVNQKTKDKLKDSLNKVISELNKPTPNWELYFKRVGHTILLIGALSQIAKDTTDLVVLSQTKEKLEEANAQLQNTSITINNNDLKEVFIINKNIQISGSKILQIEE